MLYRNLFIYLFIYLLSFCFISIKDYLILIESSKKKIVYFGRGWCACHFTPCENHELNFFVDFFVLDTW